jgi:ArsR family transcriptional regulator, arsenate/arsenite/antimonite-responsive transcriptional repressor
MKELAVLKSLAALSQANRLRVFRALVVAGKSGATPTTVAKRLKVSPATLSFHLKELLNAGLVTQERNGRNLIYRADFQRMDDLLAYLTENCCQGEKCAPPARAVSAC